MSRVMVRLLIALCVPLVGAVSARAATTYSPPVRSSDGDVLGCVAQNLSAATVEVAAEINNGLGTIVESASLAVPAGQSLTVTSTTTALFGAYCRFEFAGAADQVRGYVRLFDFGGSNTRLLYPATEAPGESTSSTTTYSPPVRSSDGDVLGCVVQNLSAATVEVAAEINNGLGTIVESASLQVPAGQALTITSTTAAVFGAYCTFTFDGDPEQVRGYIRLFDSGGSNTRLLYPASTASGGRTSDTVTFSPPVRSSDGDVLGCVVQNLSAVTVEVAAQINNGLGTVVESGTLDIPAGHALTLTSTTTAVFGAFCRFAFDGRPQQVRGYIRLFDFGGSNTRLLYPASTAPAGTSSSVVTYSPPVRSSDGDVLACIAQNLSNAAVEVDAAIDNGQGMVVESATLNVPPDQSLTVTSTTTAVFGAFCRFTFAADPDQVRGYIRLFDFGGSNTRLLYPATLADAPLPTATATVTEAPTETPTPPPTVTPTAEATSTIPDASPTATATLTEAPTETPTPPPTVTPTAEATSTIPDASPTATATAEATATQTSSPTVTSSTPVTPAATATPTTVVTPTVTGSTTPAACSGDCNGDGAVSIDELIRIVNIALGSAALEDCQEADRNNDGLVSIDEIVAAVASSLAACAP